MPQKARSKFIPKNNRTFRKKTKAAPFRSAKHKSDLAAARKSAAIRSAKHRGALAGARKAARLKKFRK